MHGFGLFCSLFLFPIVEEILRIALVLAQLLRWANERFVYLDPMQRISVVCRHFPAAFHWRCSFLYFHKGASMFIPFLLVFARFLYFIDPIYLSKKHALIASDAHFNIVDHELTENYQKFNGLLFCCLVFFHLFFVTSAKAFPLNWISCNKHFNQKINIFNR